MSSSNHIRTALIISCLLFLFSFFTFVKRIQTPQYLHVSRHGSKTFNPELEFYLTYPQRRDYNDLIIAHKNENVLREKVLGAKTSSRSTLHRFAFVNPSKPICRYPNDTEHFLLILVLSRGLNFDYRQAIRSTWGANQFYEDYQIHVQTIFFVGTDDTVQAAVRDEQEIFSDVIEVGIPENYPFVAHKELASLLWTRFYCPNARILFRADDDIFLDIFLLLRHFQKKINLNLHDGLHGWFRYNNTVHRADKWAVTKLEYQSGIYPPYTFGIGYLFSNTSCQKLINAANHPDHEIIRIGDVYITGILRELANLPFYDFENLEYAYTFYNAIPCDEYFVQKSHLLICMSKLHVGIRNDVSEFYDIWDIILGKYDQLS